jgi:hypothetical protein
LEFPLPSYSEILEELNRLTSSLQQDIEPGIINDIATACQGLSLERIRRVLSKIIAKYGEIDQSSPTLILQEKKQIIQSNTPAISSVLTISPSQLIILIMKKMIQMTMTMITVIPSKIYTSMLELP